MLDRKAPRKVRLIIIGAVVVGLAGAVVWSKRWAKPAMEVRITLSAEGQEPVEVYRNRALVVGAAEDRRLLESEIDLGQWEGQLVRLDVTGKVRASAPLPLRRGRVACSAELVAPDGAQPLEFVGWENDGSSPLHFGRVGCPSLTIPGNNTAPLAFSNSGSLWHVLRVPAGAALRLALKPVLADEAEKAKPAVVARRSKAFRAPESSRGEAQRPPDVFIYLIDALRADHLGCYGYPRETSPEIDSFAAEATLYEEAQTAATWTRPSVATLLTGLYPFVHGAMRLKGASLDEWAVLLPEILHDRGYATHGIVTNIAVNAKYGFDQGYDEFQYRYREPAEWVNDRVAERLARHPPEQPVFVYTHTMEPHSPYDAQPDSRKLFDRGFDGRYDGSQQSINKAGRMRPDVTTDDLNHLFDLYDAEIHDASRGFAGFLEVLEEAGRLDNALIVLVSDHGEAFDEHRTLGHGHTLNREETHVPLIIHYPNGRFRGIRVSQRVSLVDVMPTVLAALGIDAKLDYPLLGRSLVPSALASDTSPARRIYCEVKKRAADRVDLVAVIDEDGYKRVLDTSRPQDVRPKWRATKESIGLWSTEDDGPEQVNLMPTEPVRASYDEQLTALWLQEQLQLRQILAREPAPSVTLTDEMREELKGLGYLD